MVCYLPPPQAFRISLIFRLEASAKREWLVTKRNGPWEGGRRDAKRRFALFILPIFLCVQIFTERERERRLGTRQSCCRVAGESGPKFAPETVPECISIQNWNRLIMAKLVSCEKKKKFGHPGFFDISVRKGDFHYISFERVWMLVKYYGEVPRLGLLKSCLWTFKQNCACFTLHTNRRGPFQSLLISD